MCTVDWPAWSSSGLSLNSLIFDFFWKTKCELVSRAVVVQPPYLGGSLSLM